MLLLIALISLCYSLHITAAANKDMFAEAKIHDTALTQFLPSNLSEQATDLTLVHAFASALTHAAIMRPIANFLGNEGKDAQITDNRCIQNIEAADGSLDTLRVINAPLAKHIENLVQIHPESSPFLFVWATHHLNKIGSDLFEVKGFTLSDEHFEDPLCREDLPPLCHPRSDSC